MKFKSNCISGTSPGNSIVKDSRQQDRDQDEANEDLSSGAKLKRVLKIKTKTKLHNRQVLFQCDKKSNNNSVSYSPWTIHKNDILLEPGQDEGGVSGTMRYKRRVWS